MPNFRRLPLVALLTGAAGAIHIAAAGVHFADDPAFGVSFIGFGWIQLALAAALLVRPSRPVIAGALLFNLAAIAAWGLSRTSGLPLGHPGPEAIALADTVTVLLEAAAVGLLAMRWAGFVAMVGRSIGSVAALAVVALVAIGGTTAAVATLSSGHGQSGHGAASGHDGEAGTSDAHADESEDLRGNASHAAGPRDTADAGAVHQHDDGSWHVHEPGRAHQHDDGTVHIHPARDRSVGSSSAPVEAPSSPADAPHDDGHDHTH